MNETRYEELQGKQCFSRVSLLRIALIIASQYDGVIPEKPFCVLQLDIYRVHLSFRFRRRIKRGMSSSFIRRTTTDVNVTLGSSCLVIYVRRFCSFYGVSTVCWLFECDGFLYWRNWAV